MEIKEYVLEIMEMKNYYYVLALFADDIRCGKNNYSEEEFAKVIEEITGVNCHTNSAGASCNVLIKFLIGDKNE